jgi:hypothetical protein
MIERDFIVHAGAAPFGHLDPQSLAGSGRLFSEECTKVIDGATGHMDHCVKRLSCDGATVNRPSVHLRGMT